MFLMHLVGWVHFLTLEKWPVIDILCVPAAHSPVITRAVCSRDARWAGCVVLAWQADWCGQSSKFEWPLAELVAGPYFCRGYWRLVARVWSCCVWLWNSGGPGASAGSLVRWIRVQETSGRAGACPLVGEARTWGSCWPTGLSAPFEYSVPTWGLLWLSLLEFSNSNQLWHSLYFWIYPMEAAKIFIFLKPVSVICLYQ